MRRSTTLIIGMVVGAAVWGTALAAIPDSDGVIHACYRPLTAPTQPGRLRVIDTEAGQTCGLRSKPLSWNQTGPRGPQGIAGPTGATGAQGLQGPPGFSGYQLVRAQEYVAAGQHAEVAVLCPEGERVLGGGFLVETPLDVKVGGSAPWCTDVSCAGNFVTDRWTVVVENTGVVTRQVNVVAICASVGF
jgi:hypothetical protein